MGLYRDIMEKKMETRRIMLGLYRDYRVFIAGYIGILEKKVETTI